ncbi:uncharacterized protein HMPREF1541_06707 [Cyphellophora europaea CBS 101466]|uniref:F-box domain-containing protein n=1 Tax=Cyphellophora europaea (strain CBS 101466) TaxID=1220924 RepID=W2RQS1_CYPE1|nr:uncharacterized protein HMPREF1541_06707 [Cyphellophora europaea CBS 101466]ETN38670.1 hypothetical protein HMPREF1541_06707 [Cyphellophora europaea CBS 101466]
MQQDTPLLKLPSEVLHQILTHLECQTLISLGRTCRQLHTAALTDLLWANLLRREIPAIDFPESDPFPSSSYRDLYITHHPYWFVPKYKIWISNDPHIGRIMLCRFDPRRGCIEGYRLLAERGSSQSLLWPYNRSVVIHTFEPKVKPWLDDPILTLAHNIGPFNSRQGWWEGEIKMSVGRPGHNTSASFFLSRNVPDDPRMDVWPPRTIPTMPRVRAASIDKFQGKGHKPQSYSQISETTFRMRHWSQFSSGMSRYGVRIGEEVSTWSTIDPSLYRPTPDKPFQGIFVGDYAGHGCEFLLVMHTDQAPPQPPPPVRSPFTDAQREFIDLDLEGFSDGDDNDGLLEPSEPEPPSRTRQQFPADAATHYDDRVFSGALEAVKLTGDPNVPRGEHTFIADDIGPKGLVRIATEHPFAGARVVRSRGHVAARGFVHDVFIPSQLLIVNQNRLAQYWVPFGHISFYQRVDIDELMRSVFH